MLLSRTFAPCSASFHPMLVEMSDQDRIKGLSDIFDAWCVDWMFRLRWQGKREIPLKQLEPEFNIVKSTIYHIPILSKKNPKIIDWLMSWRYA